MNSYTTSRHCPRCGAVTPSDATRCEKCNAATDVEAVRPTASDVPFFEVDEKKYEVPVGESTIGRDRTNNVVVDGSGMAARHLVVCRSANGEVEVRYPRDDVRVFINQVPLTSVPALLAHGDRVVVGGCEMVFKNRNIPSEIQVNNKTPDVRKQGLGGKLLAEGLITEQQLEDSVAEQRLSGRPLSFILVTRGIISEGELMKWQCRRHGMLAVDVSNRDLDSRIIRLVPAGFARKHTIVPLRRVGRQLTVAMPEFVGFPALDELQFVTRLTIEPVIGGAVAISRVLDRYYPQEDEIIQEIEGLEGHESTGNRPRTGPHQPTASEPLPGPIGLSAFYPSELVQDQWHLMLVYVHATDAFHKASENARQLFDGNPDKHATGSNISTRCIERGTEIRITPVLEGFRFNPPSSKILWLEDWQKVEFRMRRSISRARRDVRTVRGRISFFVGPIQIGEIELKATVGLFPTVPVAPVATTSDLFRSIFVSYSHEDARIVTRLERAYAALGDEYFRDSLFLRSGQKWKPAILTHIDRADLFQLCWSKAARASEHVETEWRYALGRPVNQFIRPVYWELPLPEPPAELADRHFAFLGEDTDEISGIPPVGL